MTEKLITISELANMFQIKHHTIRHYENQGLLMPLEISENGYRKYGISEAYQLSFILFFKKLGLSLADIKQMLQEEIASDYTEILLEKKQEIKQERARLAQLIKTIDQQIEVNVKSSEPLYTFEQPIYLKTIERLPIEKTYVLSVIEEIEWKLDFMMSKIYYIIYDTYYDICIETTETTALKIEAGKYQVKVIESGSSSELDHYLEKIMAQQILPLIVIEDGGRFLSAGKRIVLKVLGEKDD